MSRKLLFITIGGAIGALGGWMYWYHVGCTSGGCAITSHPINSTLYGTLLGGLIGSYFISPRTDNNTNENPKTD